jgi:hypothetical protein
MKLTITILTKTPLSLLGKGPGVRGDCPDFCVNKNGTVPFAAHLIKQFKLPFKYFGGQWPESILYDNLLSLFGKNEF